MPEIATQLVGLIGSKLTAYIGVLGMCPPSIGG
jgi:hypothetical protein